MSEGEWESCDNPGPMLKCLVSSMSNRKLRLFGVACCRRVEGLIDVHPLGVQMPERQEDYRRAIVVAERFADGAATEKERNDAYWRADDSFFQNEFFADPFVDVVAQTEKRFGEVWAKVLEIVNDPQAVMNELQAQTALIREIFGNPHRRGAIPPEWCTNTVSTLAQQMYESRDFDAMPILADALQDAGCDDADILDHCRSSSPHVRGCWVVDLILGKE